KLYKPQIVKEVFSNTGRILHKNKPELVSEIHLKPNVLKLIKQGLWEAVNTSKGTAWWQRGQGIDMAGKTGTSQVISFSADQLFSKCEKKPYKHRHHGVFASFLPAEDPKIAIGVVVEHGCHGNTAAAPVARDIAQVYMKKYFPDQYEFYLERDRKIYREYIKGIKLSKTES
ncbi:MAG: penicillin-binding transpeptidase domain-containing protein, partial [Bacteriovoracales bacterium]|nr:penicillin-binding transpeptidase domain-containing protein [Bacteriovoracales bacterium]